MKAPYTFTEIDNWSGPFIANATQHLIPLAYQTLRYLEIGVHEGRSLIWMAENVLTHPKSIGVGVDTWKNRKHYATALENCDGHPQLQLYRGTLLTTCSNIPAESFDVVYIDADHSLEAVMLDTAFAWRLLKTGGLMIWDDTHSTHADCQVRPVVDMFLANTPHEPVPATLQIWARKR